ncbi:MAG TPA: response regulator transcription factor [Deltaproteobacteria bacterium]|nr:response regulator transcription factor [Deltaproteobacteria bacterium]
MRTALLIDDHAMIRTGLRRLLEASGDLEVVSEASTAAEAHDRLCDRVPDIVIADLVLADGPDGIQLTKAIKARHPDLPVLLLSGHDEELFAERAIDAGASGFVMKDEDVSSLLDAVELALAGRIWLSRDLKSRLLPPSLLEAARARAGEASPALVREIQRGNRTVVGLSRAMGLPLSRVEAELKSAQLALGLPSQVALFLFAQEL